MSGWRRGDVVRDDSGNLFCYRDTFGWYGLDSNQASAWGRHDEAELVEPLVLLVRGGIAVTDGEAVSTFDIKDALDAVVGHMQSGGALADALAEVERLRTEVAARERAAAEKALRDAALGLAGAFCAWDEDGGSPRHRFAYWEAARVVGAWAEEPSRMEGALRRAERLGAQVPGPLDAHPPARAVAHAASEDH